VHFLAPKSWLEAKSPQGIDSKYLLTVNMTVGFTCSYVGYGMKMLNMLIANKIKPILVFDGRRLKAKEATEKKRHE